MKPELQILYGSQMGSTETYAKVVHAFAKLRNFNSRISALDDFDYQNALPNVKHLLVLTSTFGNGEFPDNAAHFYKYISSSERPAEWLKGVKYAVFGFGNAKADFFCRAAKLIDTRLAELGATRILGLGLGDETCAGGHDETFQPWIKQFWATFGNTGGSAVLESSYQVTTTPDVAAPSELPPPPGFVKVPVLKNDLETAPGYPRTARVMRLDISNTAIKYQAGGHVLVYPQNPKSLVDRLLARLGLNGDDVVSIKFTETEQDVNANVPSVATIRQLLTHCLSISTVPSRSLLERLAVVATDQKEKLDLEDLAFDMRPGNAYSQLSGKTVYNLVDVLEQFPSVNVNLGQLLTHVPPLYPRFYSISTSPLAHPDYIEFVYVLESFTAKDGKQFRGCATGYLDELSAGATVAIRTKTGIASLPENPLTPIVMFGLGTGVGLFRGFIEERRALRQKGEQVGKALLYYGMRHYNKDFLFKNDLFEFERDGDVEIVTACSHDQEKFVTVSDKIDEYPEKVWKMLQMGATLYYCGLGGVVPLTVEEAVQRSVAKCAGLSDFEAVTFIKELKNAQPKRYQVEAYSSDPDSENILLAQYNRNLADRPIAEVFADAKMFCFQCEQTKNGAGCTTVGVCGKTPEVAHLQDLLIHSMKMLSFYAHNCRLVAKDAKERGIDVAENEYEYPEANRFSLEALFSTLTNVNFDSQRFVDYLRICEWHTSKLRMMYMNLCQKAQVEMEKCPIPAVDLPSITENAPADIEDLAKKGKNVGVLSRFRLFKNDALVGVQEMLVYGLKGVSAYTDHALMHGKENADIYRFIHEALAFLLSKDAKDLDKCLQMCLRCGEINFKTMELLHNANHLLGTPEPTKVHVKPVVGKCILVSGHDLVMLYQLLKVTQPLGINIYTHGEMLPAHAYPTLKAFPNLVGHFGGAWQRQTVEFDHFPGSILFTTNCIVPPKESYAHKVFTMGAVGMPGLKHIKMDSWDFGPLIEKAQSLPGFTEKDVEFTYPVSEHNPRPEFLTVGFTDEVILSHADKIIDGIKKGDITRFFVIGGCDGFEGERSYYTELGETLPKTSVVLTAGCGKYRINHIDFGSIGNTGIPRLLDMGQCNDSFSAVRVALALSEVFKCGVTDLPISIVLSWFEQKAVAVLLTLLYLGIKPLRVGPRLPAFIRPAVLDVLSKNFGLTLVDDPVQDAAKMCSATAMS